MASNNIEKIISVRFDSQQAVQGLMGLNAQIEQNNADLKTMASEGKKATREYAVLEQQTKALRNQKRDLSQMIQNETKQQNTLDGSLRNLRAQLSNLTKQYDALSKAERENINVGGKLKNQINAVTTEIKKAEEGTQRYYRNVGNYQNAILNALGMNNQFTQSLLGIAASGDGVQGAFTMIGVQAKALGRTLLGLMKNPVFLAIAGIAGAGMAFKWFYDYNVGIEQAIRLTREFTGLAGQELSDLRAEIAATANIYGKDYKETLQTVDTIMTHFGKTGKESIDIINAGFQAGGDLNGDMLNKINQLSPAFKNAGMDAEQLVALIAQTRSGIFSDKGLDAIVMGTSRIRQFSDSMRKALQGIGIDAEEMGRKLRTGELSPFAALTQISSKLKELSPNTQEYGKVMNEVFGKAGKTISTEMVQGLADMNTNLEELKKTTGEYGELTDELREKEVELQKAMNDVFGTGENGFESLTLKAKIYVKEGLIVVVNKLKDVVTWFKNLWNASEIVRGGLSILVGWFRILGKVAYTPLNMIITGLKTIGDILVALSNAFRAIKKNIASAFEGLVEVFRGIKNLDPEQVWKGVKMAANGAWDAVESFAVGVADSFSAAFSNVKDMGIDTYGDIKDIIVDIGKMMNTQFVIPTTTQSQTTKTTSSNTIITEDSPRLPDGTPIKKKTIKSPYKDKKAVNKESEEYKQQLKALEDLQKKAQELEKQAMEEEAKQSVEGIKKKYQAQEDAIRAAYGNLNLLTEEQQKEANEAMQRLIDENAKQQSIAIEKYYDQIRKKQAEEQKVYEQQAKALVNASLEASQEGTDEWLKWRLEQLRIAMEAELETASNNSQLRNAIIAKYEQQATQIYAENAQKQMEIQQAKYETMASVAGGLSQITAEFADNSKEAAVASKVLALGEIMISQAVAIANAVRAGSNAANPWQMIAQIAASVTAVTVAMVQAFKSLNEAKFATGGYIQGAGSSTSDSIPVRVSNGESIMNANTTAMFGGLLSSLNQLGGGVPIQVQQTASSVRGEDMLARAVARGVAMLPNPVVSVQDINQGQRQVEVMNERAML
ncbi:MAG: phage tail tape measure protein [Muribaculaceae bacterium]|nr:phage tail tape measure protein [Muribaculaceae bacterium]